MKKQHLILLYVLLMIAGCYPESIIAQGSYEALVAEGTLRIPRTFKDETQLPSPEAAGMNRFIDHPVSYNTGVVSPSVTLYDIQVGRYSMPVTLNYHGAGIKADDENYYVGLGWSLFVGGYISRTVRGRPDEQQEFNIRSTRTFTLGNKDDLTYLKDVLHRQIDANYDRYNYSFAGYSGSFILRKSVSGMDVVQLPETDLKIELIGEVLEGVRNFKITTPAGEQYLFTEREHTNYHYNPHVLEANPGYRTADYMCVSGWYLSSVVTSSNEDTIRFAYDRYSENRRKSEEYSLYRYFRHVNNQFYEGGNGTPHLRPIHIITYPDKCYLKSITCRSCSLHFKNSVDGTLGKVHLDHISVISVTGKAIRDISFSFTDSNSKGKLLKDLIVKCGDQLLDCRNFEYYPWSGSLHKDLFGYMNSNPHLEGYADDGMKSSINPNNVNDNNIPYSRISIWEGLITTIDTLGRDPAIRGPIDNHDSAPRNTWSEINYSVLDRDGKLGVARRHYFKSAVGLSLKSIKDAKGAVTTFEYESSECDSFRYTVGIGLRIKNITVSDPMTGRTKTRHFEYENPKSTIDFDRLSSSSFISLGGLIRHHGLSSKECSSGATFTTSCRVPGASVENAVIYYGKVTEEISGTGIEHPMKIVYEFDTSDVDQPFVSNGGRFLPNIMDCFSDRYERYTGTNVNCVNSSDTKSFVNVFTPKYIYDHIQETCWEKAPLVHKTIYRYNGHSYEPLLEEKNMYSMDKQERIDVGFFVECITRRVEQSIGRPVFEKEIIEDLHDLNFLETTLVSGRLYKDSTTTIRYFSNGTSRKSTVSYQYNGHGAFITELIPYGLFTRVKVDPLEGFKDVDRLKGSPLHLLQSVKVRSANQSLDRYFCYSSNVNSGYYNAISDKGHQNLPVMERIVVDGTDTLMINNSYGYFGNGNNLQQSSRELLYKGSVVSRQDFLDYDYRGNLLATRINGGTTNNYRWGFHDTLPVALIVGGKCAPSISLSDINDRDSLLVTTYDYDPLIGCTSITAPNNRKRSYEYMGNRLAAVKNNSGYTVESYVYSLKAQNGSYNMTSRKIYTAANSPATIETMTYYDGLGYPVNTVRRGIANDNKDIVSLVTYDALGRKTTEWLPVPVNKVSSMINEHDVASAAQAFYDNDGKPYRRFFYEESPSETLLMTQPAGDNFADHPILQETLGSDNSVDLLKCKRFRLQQDYILHEDGFYGDGELSVSKTTDSDKRTVFTFTDFRGNKILERIAIDNSTMADTYYIYDALGNLRFVLPPGLKGMEEESGNSWDIRSNEALRNMAYFYRYDRRLNCVEKKMPGTEPVTYLYDKTGNAVFSQDGNQRHLSQWHFAVPDRFGRQVFEGLCSMPDSALLADTWIHAVRSGHNSTGNGLSMNGYEVNFPMSVEKILTVKYYDNYDFMTMEGFSALPSYRSRGSAKGLLTGMATAVLPSDTCIFSAQWYDDEDRVNAYFTTNLIGGYDVTTTKYSFTGKPVSVKNLHRTRLVDVKYAYETLTNTYDSADRLVKSIKYIPRAGNITLAENTYDGLGRLATSKRNGNEAFTTTYRYNINGWLTDIQNPVFTENLFYEKSHNNSQAQYGGNISAVDWKVGGASDNRRTRGYTFRYDKMSRLIKADYFENGLASDHYSTAYGYDLMGNITSIKRNGLLDDDEFGLIDDLTLSYQGNQMVKVYDDAEGPVYKNAMHFADGTDKDVEYSYDANGNMIMDLNKNIESITYNSLGFPEHVKTSRIIRIESVRNENNIEYTYAADGRKLRVKYITTHPTVNREGKCLIPSFPVIKPSYYTFEYCGNWIFRDSTLHDILFDGGYISFERNTPHVHFYFRDHLGNVRVVTDRDGNIEQSNHYYPFGATFGESTNPNLQWFKYNGKELDTMYGLNLYDYSARAHDPLLGRFTTQDPLQEKCYGMNPYGYCVNNPVRYIDPDGERPKAYEAALMAAYVYGKDAEQYKERLLQTGWTISDFKPSIQMRYTRFYQNGLQSVLFQRTVEGVTEYAYVYAGTNSIEDAVEDFAQIAGVAFQYHTAIYNARILSDELKNSELTFVGHSLGGGEAIASSMATGRAAITFNPAAVSWLTKQIEGLNKVPNVVNYRAVGSKIGIGNIRLGGDMVNNFQEKLGLHLPGKTIGIPTGFIPTHTIYEFLKHKLPEP